jgi:hypothetical protein
MGLGFQLDISNVQLDICNIHTTIRFAPVPMPKRMEAKGFVSKNHRRGKVARRVIDRARCAKRYYTTVFAKTCDVKAANPRCWSLYRGSIPVICLAALFRHLGAICDGSREKAIQKQH